MAEFSVNPTPFDPYKTHMFRVKWDGVYVAGLREVCCSQCATARRVRTTGKHIPTGRTVHDTLRSKVLQPCLEHPAGVSRVRCPPQKPVAFPANLDQLDQQLT